MHESTRKSRFHRDMKDDIQPPSELGEQTACARRERHSGFHDGLPPKFSDLDVNIVSKNSRDYSGLSSWEQLQGNNNAKRDGNRSRDKQKISETMRAWDGSKSYRKSMSPADDRGQRTKSPSPCRGRDRSRGKRRDRSRSGGQGRSRSKNKSKSKSRSRSRSRGRGRLRHRSGSPVHDHRLESYGPNDKRRSGSGMPSQPCKDFAAGKCRRGTQCRFLHQSNHEYRDRGHPESNSIERRGSRSDHGDALKDSNIRGLRDLPRDNVSDGYANGYRCGEPQPLKNNSKAKISCRDFLKGKCRWGASCRFSHDDASNDNYLRGNRNSSFGHDHDREHQAGKPPCKFSAMGKCHRDDCRFSHDEQKSRNLELGSSDDRWVHDGDNKNMSWTSPTWEEATCMSGITKSTGWHKSLAPEKYLHDPVAAEKRTDGEWGHALQKVESIWNCQKRFDGAPKGDESQECGNNGSGMGTTEFMEKLVYKEELQMNSESPQSQIWDTNIHGTNGTHRLSNTVIQPKVSETSFYQQLQVENISRSGFHNALPDLECSANTCHSVSVPEQSINKKFDSMGSQPLMSSSESNQNQDILSVYPSSRQIFDLNGTVKHIFSSLGLQKKKEINHEGTFKTQEGLELEVPPVSSDVSQNVLTSEKFTQMTKLRASERFGNGQQLPPLDARLDGTNSELMMHCPSSTSLIPLCDSMILESKPILPSKPSNSNQDAEILPSSCEKNNRMPLEQLVLPSLVSHDSSMIQQRDGLKEEYYTSPKLKQQEPVTDAKACNKDEHMIAERCKQKEENLHSETVEAEHRIDEGMNSKDDKGMRLFKIALVEFVKEILKPTWKEGKMSREVHKTIVKKVVDKVTNTIQGDHIPKTQDKIDQYLSFSKPKITKLVQAYTERFLKN